MAYLGSTPTTQSFIAGTDYFNGTGAQVAFTLSRSVNSVDDIEVVVNNVEQSPASYSASGTTLTFSAAPSSGTDNVYVRYLSTTLQSIGVGDLSVGTSKIQTGAITTDKIAEGAVITADIANGAITAEKLNGAQSGSAPIYAARAWVNFNGTGTVAIRASGNVSSITDNGVGDYTVNFGNAMVDANYTTNITPNRGNANTTLINIARLADELSAPTTAAVRVATGVPDGSRILQREDSSYINVSIFR